MSPLHAVSAIPKGKEKQLFINSKTKIYFLLFLEVLINFAELDDVIFFGQRKADKFLL